VCGRAIELTDGRCRFKPAHDRHFEVQKRAVKTPRHDRVDRILPILDRDRA